MKQPSISIIIVTHNAKDFLRDTLKSVQSQQDIKTEIIVVDNASTDGTKEMVAQEFKSVIWIARNTSLGFSTANNLGVSRSTADTILFLNPDVNFQSDYDLKQCFDKLWSDPSIGALTPRVNLALTGKIDETSHRGFPTPWASFAHFSGLTSRFYTKNYLGYTKEHEIDAIGGMFMLLRKEVGEQVGWWDEDYPLYGEDLDFCYRLKRAGYRNWYYPKVTVLHYKGVTTGMSKQSRGVSTAGDLTTRQVKLWSVQAMEIFYRKHYVQKYPFFINWIVFLGIKLMKFHRVTLA